MIRLLFLLPIAFAAGWLTYAQSAADRCRDAGGTMRDTICRGVP